MLTSADSQQPCQQSAQSELARIDSGNAPIATRPAHAMPPAHVHATPPAPTEPSARATQSAQAARSAAHQSALAARSVAHDTRPARPARAPRPACGAPPERAQIGLRARATLDESPEAARQVRLAIARAKQGDREALRTLYVRYCDNVYGYVRSIVRDEKEAEDITQHVFMKLITAIVKYDDRGVPFSAWLLRLARNASLDHLRRRRAIPAEEVYGADCHEDDSALEAATSLRAALDALPEEQRHVVVMRHVIGLTPPEIASQMGRSESSIHGLHHRGRKALQQELRRLHCAPCTALAA